MINLSSLPQHHLQQQQLHQQQQTSIQDYSVYQTIIPSRKRKSSSTLSTPSRKSRKNNSLLTNPSNQQNNQQSNDSQYNSSQQNNHHHQLPSTDQPLKKQTRCNNQQLNQTFIKREQNRITTKINNSTFNTEKSNRSIWSKFLYDKDGFEVIYYYNKNESQDFIDKHKKSHCYTCQYLSKDQFYFTYSLSYYLYTIKRMTIQEGFPNLSYFITEKKSIQFDMKTVKYLYRRSTQSSSGITTTIVNKNNIYENIQSFIYSKLSFLYRKNLSMILFLITYFYLEITSLRYHITNCYTDFQQPTDYLYWNTKLYYSYMKCLLNQYYMNYYDDYQLYFKKHQQLISNQQEITEQQDLPISRMSAAMIMYNLIHYFSIDSTIQQHYATMITTEPTTSLNEQSTNIPDQIKLTTNELTIMNDYLTKEDDEFIIKFYNLLHSYKEENIFDLEFLLTENGFDYEKGKENINGMSIKRIIIKLTNYENLLIDNEYVVDDLMDIEESYMNSDNDSEDEHSDHELYTNSLHEDLPVQRNQLVNNHPITNLSNKHLMKNISTDEFVLSPSMQSLQRICKSFGILEYLVWKNKLYYHMKEIVEYIS